MEESKGTHHGPRGHGRNQHHHGKRGDRNNRGGHRGGHGRGGKGYDKPYDQRNYQNKRAYNDKYQQKGYNQNRNYNQGRYYQQSRGRNYGGHRAPGPRQINASKDSYYYRYYYGPYPEVKEIEITLETEIPTIKEEDILQPPSEKEYGDKMRACDEKIQELRNKITAINDQKRAITSNKRRENQDKESEIQVEGKNFKQLLNEKNEIYEEVKVLKEEQKKQNDAMTKVNADIRKLQKFIDSNYKNPDEVLERTAALEYELTTTTMTSAQEKEMRKQKKFLEKSIQYYGDYESLQKKLKK